MYVCDDARPRWKFGSGLGTEQIEITKCSFAALSVEGPFQTFRKVMMGVLKTHPDCKEWSSLVGDITMDGW